MGSEKQTNAKTRNKQNKNISMLFSYDVKNWQSLSVLPFSCFGSNSLGWYNKKREGYTRTQLHSLSNVVELDTLKYSRSLTKPPKTQLKSVLTLIHTSVLHVQQTSRNNILCFVINTLHVSHTPRETFITLLHILSLYTCIWMNCSLLLACFRRLFILHNLKLNCL